MTSTRQLPLPGMGEWLLREDRRGEPLIWNTGSDTGTAMVHRIDCPVVPQPPWSGRWQELPSAYEKLGMLDRIISESYGLAKRGRPHVAFCHRCLMEPDS